MREIVKRGVLGTVDDSMGESEYFSCNLRYVSNYYIAGRGERTSSSSWTNSSRASGSVSMIQCSCATRQISVASSRSLKSWTLLMRASSAMRLPGNVNPPYPDLRNNPHSYNRTIKGRCPTVSRRFNSTSRRWRWRCFQGYTSVKAITTAYWSNLELRPKSKSRWTRQTTTTTNWYRMRHVEIALIEYGEPNGWLGESRGQVLQEDPALHGCVWPGPGVGELYCNWMLVWRSHWYAQIFFLNLIFLGLL